jgi:DNA primase
VNELDWGRFQLALNGTVDTNSQELFRSQAAKDDKRVFELGYQTAMRWHCGLAVELHACNASIDDIERPDMLVFDLDPGDGVARDFVIETALMPRQMPSISADSSGVPASRAQRK